MSHKSPSLLRPRETAVNSCRGRQQLHHPLHHSTWPAPSNTTAMGGSSNSRTDDITSRKTTIPTLASSQLSHQQQHSVPSVTRTYRGPTPRNEHPSPLHQPRAEKASPPQRPRTGPQAPRSPCMPLPTATTSMPTPRSLPQPSMAVLPSSTTIDPVNLRSTFTVLRNVTLQTAKTMLAGSLRARVSAGDVVGCQCTTGGFEEDRLHATILLTGAVSLYSNRAYGMEVREAALRFIQCTTGSNDSTVLINEVRELQRVDANDFVARVRSPALIQIVMLSEVCLQLRSTAATTFPFVPPVPHGGGGAQRGRPVGSTKDASPMITDFTAIALTDCEVLRVPMALIRRLPPEDLVTVIRQADTLRGAVLQPLTVFALREVLFGSMPLAMQSKQHFYDNQSATIRSLETLQTRQLPAVISRGQTLVFDPQSAHGEADAVIVLSGELRLSSGTVARSGSGGYLWPDLWTVFCGAGGPKRATAFSSVDVIRIPRSAVVLCMSEMDQGALQAVMSWFGTQLRQTAGAADFVSVPGVQLSPLCRREMCRCGLRSRAMDEASVTVDNDAFDDAPVEDLTSPLGTVLVSVNAESTSLQGLSQQEGAHTADSTTTSSRASYLGRREVSHGLAAAPFGSTMTLKNRPWFHDLPNPASRSTHSPTTADSSLDSSFATTSTSSCDTSSFVISPVVHMGYGDFCAPQEATTSAPQRPPHHGGIGVGRSSKCDVTTLSSASYCSGSSFCNDAPELTERERANIMPPPDARHRFPHLPIPALGQGQGGLPPAAPVDTKVLVETLNRCDSAGNIL